jgi:acetyltransferase
MAQYNLNRIFKPRQVAVVGASEKTGTIGNALIRNLIDGGFAGTGGQGVPLYDRIYHKSRNAVGSSTENSRGHGV